LFRAVVRRAKKQRGDLLSEIPTRCGEKREKARVSERPRTPSGNSILAQNKAGLLSGSTLAWHRGRRGVRPLESGTPPTLSAGVPLSSGFL